jgi:potassium-transporting ATPase potassium-binding subunit
VSASALLTLGSLGLAILVATPLLGGYMAHALQGEPTVLSPLLGPIERWALRAGGIRADMQQTWQEYARSF